jgi:hypothetical protein
MFEPALGSSQSEFAKRDGCRMATKRVLEEILRAAMAGGIINQLQEG